ncbi:calmodulin-1 [Eurytemora carolleeae]|uniref:calmodulin-1 n=1 Tax=Eurytemora carolleeae TaxID=1294199 RepID=UPI000C7932CA|nr:calmodulin-1 [Eurytemora carolleeae]XP_023332909.1 calmodulin-1 [Eurytemora carolleeae]|eukprot:XP_023332908.1 calmodulin-1-like [Eurytemora affinis]
MGLADQFSDEQIDEVKEAFNLFKNSDENIAEGQIITVLRALGIHVTEEQLQVVLAEAVEENGGVAGGNLDFPEFLSLLGKLVTHQGGEDHIKEAFRIFDKDEDGYLTIAELTKVMTTMGEKFTVKETQEMIKASADENGLIDYASFSKLLSGGAPSTSH